MPPASTTAAARPGSTNPGAGNRRGHVPPAGPSEPLDAVGNRRVAAYDGIRTLAVTGVLVSHAGLNRGGWIGVDLFFVLSGFLITSLLLRSDDGVAGVAAFVGRRMRRLVPLLLFVVALVSGLLMLGAYPAALDPARAYPQGLAAVGYSANWLEIARGASYWDQFAQSPFGHLWSLSIEEQFYLVFPFVMLGVRRLSPTARAWTLGGMAAAAATWSIGLGFSGASNDRIYFGTDTRAVALLLGALAAVVLARPGALDRLVARRSAVGVLGGGALVALAVGSALSDGKDTWIYRGGLVGCSVLGAVLVVAVCSGAPLLSGPLSSRPMAWIGERSYGIYLIHLPVFVAVPRNTVPPVVVLLVGGAVTVVLAAVVHRSVERAFLDIPTRATPSTGGTGDAVASHRASGRVLLAGVVVVAGGLAVAVWLSSRPQAVAQVTVARPKIAATRLAQALDSGDYTVATPTTLRPARTLMVVGDSTAGTLAYKVQVPGVTVINNALIGCAQLRNDALLLDGTWQPTAPGCRQWRDDLWPQRMQPADATLWFFGAWDLADAKVNGKVLAVGTPEHKAWVMSELEDARRVLTAGGRRLLLTSALCYPDARFPNAYQRALSYNDIFAEFARTHTGVEYLPIIDFLCDGATPVQVDGENPRPDGTHFATGTSVKIWEWLLPYLLGTRSGISQDNPTGE